MTGGRHQAEIAGATSIDHRPDLLADPEAIRDGIAVFHYGSGGAYLFYSMLDFHPEIVGLPIVNPCQHVAKILFWRMLEMCSDGSETTIDHLTGILWECLCSTELPTEGSEARFRNLAAIGVKSRLDRGKPISIAFMFKLFIAAILRLYGYPVRYPRPLLIWNEHNPGHNELFNIELLRAINPGMKFVTIVRYPEKSVDAHFDRYFRYHRERISHRITMQHFDQRALARIFIDSFADNHVLFGANASVVRFEDIHNSTRLAMQGVARQLGLSWDDALLNSTSWGQPWVYENRFSGTRTVKEDELTTKHLDWFDRARLRYFLSAQYTRWFYRKPGWSSHVPAPLWKAISLLVPFRTQRLRLRASISELGQVDGWGDRLRAARRELQLFWRSHLRLQERMFERHRKHGRDPSGVAPVLYEAEPHYRLDRLRITTGSTGGTSALDALPAPAYPAPEQPAAGDEQLPFPLDTPVPLPPGLSLALDRIFANLLASCLAHLKGPELRIQPGMDFSSLPPIAIYGTGSGALSLKSMLEARLGIRVIALLDDGEPGPPLGGTPVLAYDKVASCDKSNWAVLIATDHWEETVPDWEDVALALERTGFRTIYNATPLMLGAMYSRDGVAARPSQAMHRTGNIPA